MRRDGAHSVRTEFGLSFDARHVPHGRLRYRWRSGFPFAFVVGAVVSLATTWVLVSRLERVGERVGLSEALLGMAAALAADAPEVTASVTALVQHQQTVGAGVVVGSNVFNLAALLGLGAVVSGGIVLHRKVVLLGGVVAIVVSLVCLLVAAGVAPPFVGLLVALVVLVPYIGLLGTRGRLLGRLRLPPRWVAWLTSAVVEEEVDLEAAIRPLPPSSWPEEGEAPLHSARRSIPTR